MSSSTSGELPKRKMHRTITGSRVDLTELENVIQSASVRDFDVETSSVSSTRSGGGRSNIIHVGLVVFQSFLVSCTSKVIVPRSHNCAHAARPLSS